MKEFACYLLEQALEIVLNDVAMQWMRHMSLALIWNGIFIWKSFEKELMMHLHVHRSICVAALGFERNGI